MDHFVKVSSKFVTGLFLFYVCLFVCLGHEACGILVPLTRTRDGSSAHPTPHALHWKAKS